MMRLSTFAALLLLPWCGLGAVSVTTFSGTNGAAVTSNTLQACTVNAIGVWYPCTNLTEPQTNMYWTNASEWKWAQDAGGGVLQCAYSDSERYYNYWFNNYPSNCIIGYSIWMEGASSYHWYDPISIIGDGDYCVMSLSDMPPPGPYITLHGGSGDSAKWPIPTNTWLWVSMRRLTTAELTLNVYSLPDLSLLWTTNWAMTHTNIRCNAVRLGRTDSHGYGSNGVFRIGTLMVDTNQNGTFPLLPTGYRYATNVAFAVVSNQVAQAVDGDLVSVPAGSATWTNTLTVTNGIWLRGAGSNQTIITGPDSFSGYLVKVAPAVATANPSVRVSDLTFSVGVAANCVWLEGLSFTNTLTNLRVDHCEFLGATNGTNRALFARGHTWGVFDRNRLSGSVFLDVRGEDENSWNNLTFSYGTTNTLVIENNDITSDDSFIAGGQGGRYVLRYNILRSSRSSTLSPSIDVHGNQTTVCATMGAEIYGNLLLFTNNINTRWFDHRGGMALAYSNVVATAGAVTFYVREEYDDALQTITNVEPQHVNNSYYWEDRRWSGALLTAGILSDCCAVLAENGTHWNQQASFNGTVGVGVGLYSVRPASCSTGVGYWATDSNVFYKATAPNVWSAYYTPLSYPHPLVMAQDGTGGAMLWGGGPGSTNSTPASLSPTGVAIATAARANVGRIITP
jgi:hypothetical protein